MRSRLLIRRGSHVDDMSQMACALSQVKSINVLIIIAVFWVAIILRRCERMERSSAIRYGAEQTMGPSLLAPDQAYINTTRVSDGCGY